MPVLLLLLLLLLSNRKVSRIVQHSRDDGTVSDNRSDWIRLYQNPIPRREVCSHGRYVGLRFQHNSIHNRVDDERITSRDP